jgi:hypothetical protein
MSTTICSAVVADTHTLTRSLFEPSRLSVAAKTPLSVSRRTFLDSKNLIIMCVIQEMMNLLQLVFDSAGEVLISNLYRDSSLHLAAYLVPTSFMENSRADFL